MTNETSPCLFLKINYIWEFELVEKLVSEKNESQNAYLAIAGGLIHNRFENNVVQYFNSVGRKELKRKKDMFGSKRDGFTIEKAIRDQNGKIVKAFDKKKNRFMICRPDIVDYGGDEIIDLKSYYLKKEPHKDGIFITADQSGSKTPKQNRSASKVNYGFYDAFLELKEYVENKIAGKYESQLYRYKNAYNIATNRECKITVYIILFTKTDEKLHEMKPTEKVKII